MNYESILIGLSSFLIIGVFHPIVIKTEYHFGKKIWPAFLLVGLGLLTAALFTVHIVPASMLSIGGFTALWCIKELYEQERRVARGWFPQNPKKADKIKSAYKQSKNIYDAVLTQSTWWSRLYIRFFWGVDDVAIAKTLFSMLPDHFSGALLDVPCGTLNLTTEKFARLQNAAVTCLDYSEEMLAGAKRRIGQYELSHVTAMQGDVGNLPFADAAFDAVLSMNGFHVFPDKQRAYSETARVLKPGGQFFGCFYVKGGRRRSDFVANAVLAKKGWFTPPFETKDEVRETLQSYYSSVELYSDEAMIWFRCIK